MIYIYLDDHTINLLSLTKTMLGQYNVSHFSKNHTTSILHEGKVESIDLLASAIKEALTLAQPHSITEKEVTLILPQQSFYFVRQEIPVGTDSTAIVPLLKDKLLQEHMADLAGCTYTCSKQQRSGEAVATLFAINTLETDKFKQACSLVGLQVKSLLPETLSYFKLFEKTLREEKKELIWYIHYSDTAAFGYLYDSLGLKESRRYEFVGDPQKFMKESADEIAAQGTKINRLILSGSDSSKVRQDHFTKTVGVWTNPLEKILVNFYEQYIRILTTPESYNFPLLDLDACLGAFIYDYEKDHNGASESPLMASSPEKKKPMTMPKLPGLSGRDITIFLLSLVVTSLAIVAFTKFRTGSFSLPSFSGNKTATVTAIPTSKPLPSPTSAPTVKRSELTIKLLNGEGTPGLAGKVGNALKEIGYTDIAGANADSFDFDKTEVQIQKSKKQELSSVLVSDLKKFVDIDPAKIKETPEGEKADVVIIIGKDFVLE